METQIFRHAKIYLIFKKSSKRNQNPSRYYNLKFQHKPNISIFKNPQIKINLLPRGQNDETLPNFIKRKHPRKGEKKKQGARPKVQANKQPKKDGPYRGKGNTKNQTLLQSHEAYQLKKGQVNSPI